MKNIDAAIIINREVDDSVDPPRQYLGFKLEKYRGKPNDKNLYVFFHPFEQGNGILLTPDVDKDKPLSRMRVEDFNPVGPTLMSSDGKINFDLLFKRDDDPESIIAKIKGDMDKDNRDIIEVPPDPAEEIMKDRSPEGIKRANNYITGIENDLIERRKRELKEDKDKYKRNSENLIIISSSKNNKHEPEEEIITVSEDRTDYTYDELLGLFKIHSRKKKEKQEVEKRDGCIVIHSRKKNKIKEETKPEEEIITVSEDRTDYTYDELLGLFKIHSRKKKEKPSKKIGKNKDGCYVISKRNHNTTLPGSGIDERMIA